MKQGITVSLELQTLQDVSSNLSEKEILKMAEANVIEQLQSKFTPYKYSIKDGISLKFEDCEPGRMIKYNGEFGYVFNVNPSRKFPVSIILSGGRAFQVKPIVLEVVEDESLLGSIWNSKSNPEPNAWSAGENAFLPTSIGIKKVIVTMVTKTQIHLYELSTQVKNVFFPIKQDSFQLISERESRSQSFIKR